MEHPMRRRALSECANGGSTLRGLAISFPTDDSSFDPPSVSQVPSNSTATTDADQFSSDVSRAASTSTKASTAYSTVSTVAFPTMRSSKGMQGLLEAELGGSMVEFDPYSSNATGSSGFKTGHQIGLTPNLPSTATPRTRQRAATHSGASLARSGTLFSNDASASRKSAELKTLLGGSSHKLPSKATIPPPSSGPSDEKKRKPRRSASTSDIIGVVMLEKAKSKARVEVDIELESETVVEGGYLRGKMEVTIRKPGKNESPIWIGGGKMRIVGFEGLPNNDIRYTFYQCAEALTSITSASHHLFASSPDEEGFCRAREGTHILPFAMKIPVTGTAKGALQTKSGAMVRYIAMGSIKIKDQGSPVKSIAHFYRHVEIYPFLGQSVLSSAGQPLRTSTAQTLFMGGSGKLQVAALLHRRIWIAGQRCYVHVTLNNETTKKVKTLTFTLVRTTTMFQPKAELDAKSPPAGEDADIDACETSTSKKEVAQCTLEMGQKGERGCVTAKGFWTGVEAGGFVELSHFIQIPSDALSFARGRLIEVDYMLRISAATGPLSSDVTVQLPVRIINFLSIDPPPTMPRGTPIPSSFNQMALDNAAASTATLPSPKKEAPQARRRSVSMQNVRQHEEQLRLWESSHGKAAEGQRKMGIEASSVSRNSTSQSQQGQQPPPQRSMTPVGQRSTTPTSQRHQPQLQCDGLSSTSVMVSPTRSAMRASTSTQSSPTRWPQQLSYNYPGTATPFRQPSPTRSVSQASPTRSILSSPERGKARAQEMFGGGPPTVSRSKTVAFADDLRLQEGRTQSHSRNTTRSQIFPSGTPNKSQMLATAITRSESVPLQNPKLRHLAEPSPTFSPVGMKLTASAAADDEMDTGSESSGYTDDDDAIYGTVGSALVSHRTPARTSTRAADQSFEVKVDQLVSASPIIETGLAGDMSRDGIWEEQDEEDRSLDAEELTEKAAIRLGKEEYLLETSLPMIGDPTGSQVTASPSPTLESNPPLWERVDGGRSSPRKTQSQEKTNTPRGMGRSQSALLFSASRYPSFHASAIVQPRPQVRTQPRPVTSFSVGDVVPRPARGRTHANSGPHSAGSMVVDGFPFPPVPPPTEEEARWSGVPTTAQITKVSRGIAVMTSLPTPTRPRDRLSSSQTQASPTRPHSQASTTGSERHHRSVLSLSTPTEGIPELRRSRHKSNLSISSNSTDSSLLTQTSTTSSSRDVPLSVKTKIAQLEARNKALRAFSTVTTPSGDESDGSGIKKSWSTLVMPKQSHYRTASSIDLRSSAAPEDSASVSSCDSRYSGDMRASRIGRIEHEAFNSPVFKKSSSQGKWVAELKKN
ncbi:hypothetical protein FRB90_003218 [Tulasnella sp. 427]|nr:hypothetical protein FRB90_003218 [Tulasnella sp. 427]